ncbi:MAG: cysteate synthase [Nitrospiraceae bacterium]|nr:cysteate synthase [Nitrospiraceae bacterium]
MSHFSIQCRNCGKLLENAYCAFCEHCKDALLVTQYYDTRFSESAASGVWRFNWLPVHEPNISQPGPVVYRSKGLADKLGLSNLFIAFNGYWPEKGALLETCTFKEFEAAIVLQNARENNIEGLIVASAGNTARAFAHLSATTGFPAVIVVPRMCLMEMWYLEDRFAVPTLAVHDGDYSDAIDVAKRIAMTTGFPFEGGVKNIAKRDGLGIVMLEAVSKIGKLPDHYIQAVGSGTGAVGAWEMTERFVKDGRYGSRLPILHLGQNLPFAPMMHAWNKRSRTLSPEDLNPELISQITTRVLSTRYPAYSVKGGVYDALTSTNGKMYGITNDAVYAGMELFLKTEGIDLVPASGVAVAVLKDAVRTGAIKKDETVLVNITGGGEARLKEDKKTYSVVPKFISKNISEKEIEALLCNVLKKNS